MRRITFNDKWAASAEQRLRGMARTHGFVVVISRGYRLNGSELARLKKTVSRLTRRRKLEVPRDLMAFFSQSNGFGMHWVANEPGAARERRGMMMISDLLTFYGVPLGEKEDADSPDRLFDRIDKRTKVVAVLGPGRESPTLYYCRGKKRLKLSLDVRSYLEQSLNARALVGWQAFFVEDAGSKPRADVAARFQKRLLELFPDADPRPYEAAGSSRK